MTEKAEIRQLSMYDALDPRPEMWDCRETCRHFGESVDYPSWWNGEARCCLPFTGKNTESVLFDNRWFMYCKLYEPKK